MTYGRWKALTQRETRHDDAQLPPLPSHKNKQRKRRYTDQQAFSLWQKGYTDAQIASIIGVSRALIQRWRDTLELPSNFKHRVDTKKYRLAQMQDGTFVVLKNDDEL